MRQHLRYTAELSQRAAVSSRILTWRARLPAGLAVCVAAGLASCTAADQGNPVRGAATLAGFATTTPEPKDFVIARRSGAPLEYIPVGRGGIERPVQPRNVAGVRTLESELDATRDRSEAFARRNLPGGAYGQPLPSVAAPPRPASAAGQPNAGAPASYPVSAQRAREMRDNARAAGQKPPPQRPPAE